MNLKLRAPAVRTALASAIALLVLAGGPVGMAAPERETRGLTPLVMFPAFHFTRLRVTVHNQVVAPGCPTSGSFEDWFQNDHPSATFSQVCQDRLLTLRFDAHSGGKPFSERFSNERGVRVEIIDYGKTQSAPAYEAMYARLEAVGYQRNRDIRVAGYDSRLTPDMGDFLERTKRLIESTFRENGNRPVHLAGHSNGPLYAQYLLTHTSQEWRDKFIHGFTPIAGNFPGQGGVYLLNFTGLNIIDFTFPTTAENAESSARMYLSAPSTYMSSADPSIFDRKEVVFQDASTGRSYTPSDFPKLFRDAGLPDAARIAEHYVGFVKFADRAHFPRVDVFAEKGSGIDTVVGIRLPNLSVGQVVDAHTQFFTRDGDINQEDLTNDAVGVWSQMRCFHFSLTDSPGVNHFELPSNAGLLDRLVSALALPRSDC
jgi:lecithin-cholesterol acyltransferase